MEMVVIVVSVVLGFVVNDWRQDAARSAIIATAMEAVREEVDANRAELESAVKYHTILRRALASDGVVARIDLTRTSLDTASAARLAETLHAALLHDPQFHGEDAPQIRRWPDGGWQLPAGPRKPWRLLTFEGDTAFVRIQELELRPPSLVEYAWATAQATQAIAYMDPSMVAAMARASEHKRNLEATVDRILQMMYFGPGIEENVGLLFDLVGNEQDLLQAYDDLLRLLPNATSPDSVTRALPDSTALESDQDREGRATHLR